MCGSRALGPEGLGSTPSPSLYVWGLLELQLPNQFEDALRYADHLLLVVSVQ